MAKRAKPPGSGRKMGTPNKVTVEIREAFRNLLEMNTPNMISWMERVAAVDPAKALTLCSDFAEFCTPKLARTEHSGVDGEPIKTETTLRPQLSRDEWLKLRGLR